LNEGIAFFVVVMEVDLDIRNTETHDLREPVEDFTLVLLLGIEKGVLCGISCGVFRGFMGNAWPFLPPESDAGVRSLEGSAHTPRLVVVGDCDPHSLDLCCPGSFSEMVLEIGQQPDFSVSRELH
jgi:hypothetical protein